MKKDFSNIVKHDTILHKVLSRKGVRVDIGITVRDILKDLKRK